MCTDLYTTVYIVCILKTDLHTATVRLIGRKPRPTGANFAPQGRTAHQQQLGFKSSVCAGVWLLRLPCPSLPGFMKVETSLFNYRVGMALGAKALRPTFWIQIL